MKQTVMAMGLGIDIDNLDKLKKETLKDANAHFEQMIREKPQNNGKQLCISAYEGILLDGRRNEKDILNQFRHKEIEKNRPPADGWYTNTDKEFSKELYRNRVALKPNNLNKVYLNTLMDPYLY